MLYQIFCINIIILILVCVLLYLNNKNLICESFSNEWQQYCGVNNNSTACNNEASCKWSSVSGLTMKGGKNQTYSFCDVK
jgi:hypothetical protein